MKMIYIHEKQDISSLACKRLNGDCGNHFVRNIAGLYNIRFWMAVEFQGT